MDAPVVDESAQDEHKDEHQNGDRTLTDSEAQISVEHRPRLAAVVGLAAAAVTVAWFSRALQTGHLVDWLVCVGLGMVGLVQLAVLRDSRAPLLVADDQGVRIRHGVTWSGLRWQDIDHVDLDGLRRPEDTSREVPFSWLLGDRRIVVHPHVVEGAEDPAETFAIRLSATTRVVTTGLTGDLVADLDLLSSGRAPVVVVSRRDSAPESTPEAGPVDDHEDHVAPEEAPEDAEVDRQEEVHEPAPASTQDADDTDLWLRSEEDAVEAAEEPTVVVEKPVEAVDAGEVLEEDPEAEVEEFAPVDPARPVSPAVRAEVVRESVRIVASGSAIPAQRTAQDVVHARVDEPGPIGESLGPIGDVEPFRTRPAADPVIGPQVAAARRRARLSIDELSDRTRIRPHVLESIEVDDFEPCGGDFYARGHLRTLARIFGLDGQELLAVYDERYAHGEIEARQVFEAELATGIGGGVRAAASGPRWSMLVAAVIAMGLVWGGARLFTDTPKEVVSPAPGVIDSAGLASGKQADTPKSTLAPLAFTAVGASPQVVVRDRTGRILWAGQLAEGQHQQIIGEAPFDVTTSNGAAVKVSYLGKPRGTVGTSSAADSRKFG